MRSGGPFEGLCVALFRATPISGRGHVKGFGTEIAGVKFEASYRVRVFEEGSRYPFEGSRCGFGFKVWGFQLEPFSRGS